MCQISDFDGIVPRRQSRSRAVDVPADSSPGSRSKPQPLLPGHEAPRHGPAARFAAFQVPKMDDWKRARQQDDRLLSEWQVYRMLDVSPPWAAFQFLVRERLRDEELERGPWRRTHLHRLPSGHRA